MKRLICDTFDSLQEALEYEKNKPYNLEEYCKTLGYSKADTINFEEWAKKAGYEYIDSSLVGWEELYKKYATEGKEMIKKEKKNKNQFLIDSQKLLKNCYEKGAEIEYFDGDKWNILPPGLPLDFSQFAEGKIRLKFNDPTYEQVMEFKAKYGEPMVTEWDFENIPMLAFCYNHNFCNIVTVKNNIKKLQWYAPNIWRFYGKKEYLPETSQKELEEIFKKRAEENLKAETYSLAEYTAAFIDDKEKASAFCQSADWDLFLKRTREEWQEDYKKFSEKYENKKVGLYTFEDYLESQVKEDERIKEFKAFLKINYPAMLAIFEPILYEEWEKLYREFLKKEKGIERISLEEHFKELPDEQVEDFRKFAKEHPEEYGDPEHWDKCYIETKGGESNSTADMINAINESLNCLPNSYDISQVKSILKQMLKLIIKVGSK